MPFCNECGLLVHGDHDCPKEKKEMKKKKDKGEDE